MIIWKNKNTITKCFLSGADYKEKNQVGLYTIGNDDVAVALSAGRNPKPHSSGRVNEDSVGAVLLKEEQLFLGVVADSHWGGLTSDALARTFVHSFAAGLRPRFQEKGLSKNNLAVFRQYLKERIRFALNTTLLQLTLKNPGPGGESTLIVVVVHADILYYGAIADSVIYLFDGKTHLVLNNRNLAFLDEICLNPGILETGSRKINPDTTLVLATDGLPECIYGKRTLSPADLAASVQKSPTSTARSLVEQAFASGGEDNLGLVVYHQPGILLPTFVSEPGQSLHLVNQDKIWDNFPPREMGVQIIHKIRYLSVPGEKDSKRGYWVPQHWQANSISLSELKIMTYNIYFGTYYLEERLKALLAILRQSDADIIALQEVTEFSLNKILCEKWIGDSYFLSNFKGDSVKPYGLLVLSRIAFRNVSFLKLSSRQGRHLLICVFNINGVEIILATVHLESRHTSAKTRGDQMRLIFTALYNHPHVILTGDFNFCASWKEENQRIPREYKDIWQELMPGDPGYTEDSNINLMLMQLKGRPKMVRFDRILYKSNPQLWSPVSIERLGKEPLLEHPSVFPSDHFGLKATFRSTGNKK